MSNIERIPLQDNYEVELAQGIDDTALTFSVDIAPSYTPTTRKTWAVLNPGKANMELVKVDGYDAGTKVVTIPTGGRAQPLYEGHTATAYSHGSGSVVMISDNFAFWDSIYDAVNSKLDANGGNTGADFDMNLTTSDWRLRSDSGVMKFTDDEQAEVSLKTLADAAGVNDKTKVSNADTTSDYLSSKIAVGTGLSTSIVNPAGDEQLQIDLDTQYTAISDHIIYTSAFLTGGTSAESAFNNWLAVLDGSFRLSVDGVAYNVDGINFTGVTSMADVASKIQVALRLATSGTETVVWSTNRFIFTSGNTTSSSAITVLETSTGTVGTDISGAGASNWLDADTGNGVVTNAVLNRVADAGKTPILDASGNLKSTLLEANLREADTFFGITDMTGAQANTLVAGVTSYADTVHTHDRYNLTKQEQLGASKYIVSVLEPSAFTKNLTGSSIGVGQCIQMYIETGNTSGDDAIMVRDIGAGGNINTAQVDWSRPLELIFEAQVVSAATTNQDLFMGLYSGNMAAVPANHVSVTRHVGFFIEDGTLYASNADGTTQTATDISAGITVTDMHIYEIVFRVNTNSLEFYVDGVLEATHTTNLPSDAFSLPQVTFGVTTVTTTYKGLRINSNIALRYTHA